jgi:hypothetical protein
MITYFYQDVTEMTDIRMKHLTRIQEISCSVVDQSTGFPEICDSFGSVFPGKNRDGMLKEGAIASFPVSSTS